MAVCRRLTAEEITLPVFLPFNRYQDVKKCWRKENGEWVLKEIAFVEQWDHKDKEYLVECLTRTVAKGGAVIGAFVQQGRLVGFASVEPEPLGTRGQYRLLSSLHVSFEWRGNGIGKALFSLAAGAVGELGGEKMYISGHSSEETQRFYRRLGCVETEEYDDKLFAAEPCDCHLEYLLK